MKAAAQKTLKFIGYAVGIIILYALAQEYAWVSYIIGAMWAGFVLSEIVKNAVRDVLQEELRSLREQSYQNTERLEVTERKVSAIWNRIRQISGDRP